MLGQPGHAFQTAYLTGAGHWARRRLRRREPTALCSASCEAIRDHTWTGLRLDSASQKRLRPGSASWWRPLDPTGIYGPFEFFRIRPSIWAPLRNRTVDLLLTMQADNVW